MVVLVVTLKPAPGQESRLQNAVRAVLPLVSQESGVREYTLHKAAKTPGKYLLYEKYQDKAALNLHMSQPYIKELLTEMSAYLSEPPSVEFYEDLAALPSSS